MSIIDSMNYSPSLVLLSVLIAVVSSYVAFGVAARVSVVRNTAHIPRWVVGGGVAMGSGIWSMHFIGMLAMQMPFPIEYDFNITALSLIVALFFSSLAFVLINKFEPKSSTIIGGSLLMGTGIASMHYIGMAAIKMPVEVTYNSVIVLISLLIAILTSFFSLTRFSHFKTSTFASDISEKVLSAVLMGGGIAAMHYVAMEAAVFHFAGSHEAMGLHTELIIPIVIIVFLIQGGGVVTILMDENLFAKERIIDLEKQFMQAQKMEAMGTLVGGIAHDFNNMLTGMMGYLYFAKKRAKDNLEVVEQVENAEELGAHASEMIKQLLTFARKDSAEMTIFSLTKHIRDTFKLARVAVPNQIKCISKICDDELLIRGNKTQIQQLMMNLMNNASDALHDTEQAEITCALSLFEADKGFRDRHPDIKGECFAQLSMTDNGNGIPESKLQNIFEPFFTTKGVGKGTGLGLSMAYGAVKSHGGIIEAESQLGEGTVFYVFLPIVDHEVSL